MVSRQENELLTRTGPGTPMGELFRRYWVPALLSEELTEPDGPPIRARLLGEDLVAFRATNGQIGLLAEPCAHRGASLYFGRNEQGGLRCVYHGWKYDVSGACVDMPNEPAPIAYFGLRNAESTVVRTPHSALRTPHSAIAYPCVERGGMIWAYMGPPDRMPPLPELEWATVPSAHRYATKRLQRCNYLQALEGGIDSSHVPFLHFDQYRERPLVSGDLAPTFDVAETDFGLLVAARRDAGEDAYYWRITPFLMPWYTLIPPYADNPIGGHAWVPIDDDHCWNFTVEWHPARPLTEAELAYRRAGEGLHPLLTPGSFLPLANPENDFLIDREIQRSKDSFTGIKGIPMQDDAAQQSQGPICDRTQEHLVRADRAIVELRRVLLAAATMVRTAGDEPPGLDPASQRVRPASIVLPREIPWQEGAREALATRTAAFAGA